jgi:predicted  nucleic acid-binding Zn-ribbon protein
MHPHITELLALHEIDRSRQRLVGEREKREQRQLRAERALANANAAATEAAEKAVGADALIRQYSSRIEELQEQIASLRAQQMEAKSNKDYVAILNKIEEANAEAKLTREKPADLRANIDAMKARAEAISAKRDVVKAKHDEVLEACTGETDVDASEAELTRLYREQRSKVESNFLEVYERLVSSKHPMPVMPVDPKSRATPMGNVLPSHNFERLMGGELMIDEASNAILYLADEKKPEEDQVEVRTSDQARPVKSAK